MALRPDKVTGALALAAVATAGTVVGAEIARNARRRLRARREGRAGGAHGAGAAALGAQDTLTVAVQGYGAAPHHERVLINLLSGFTGAFVIARLMTAGIRGGWLPIGHLEIAGRHIHHFVPGMLIAFGSGTASLVTDSARLERALAVPFGAGLGLTFDEAALLLDLRDVYWTREGLLSVQASLGLAAIFGAAVISIRILRRGERQAESTGAIPGPHADYWLRF